MRCLSLIFFKRHSDKDSLALSDFFIVKMANH